MSETERNTAIAVNIIKLQQYAQRFFDEILQSISQIPLDYLKVVTYLAKKCKLRYFEAPQVGVATFVLTRFYVYLFLLLFILFIFRLSIPIFFWLIFDFL